MTAVQTVPELLAPAGSLDAVRAALANGADSIYLGAGRFNARDDGAQLSLEELGVACRLAHQRARRIYLTLNTLVKPDELIDALEFLGEAIDCGIDAVIVQDLGLIKLIRELFPSLEIHGSTQMTVHDASGAEILRDRGVRRVVLARENTLDDIRSIAGAVPGIGLETFIHGALCISYSGQCFMSGMISERSANRGSCAQSCRKDYELIDTETREVLDSGFVISARDLAAAEHLNEIAQAGISCLKVEGRKKKPEYVATVTDTYRRLLERMRAGEHVRVAESDMTPLVQIFSRGFTGGMYGGRDGRNYVTRTQPDNLGVVLGTVVEQRADGIVVEVSDPVRVNDGLGFDAPAFDAPARGFRVTSVRSLGAPADGKVRQFIATRENIPAGWRVVRSSQAALLEAARHSYSEIAGDSSEKRTRLDVRVEGSIGQPLIAVFYDSASGHSVETRSAINLAHSQKRALDSALLREQLGRLGGTPFVLGALDASQLDAGMFLPVSELNHLRQSAIEELTRGHGAHFAEQKAARSARIASAVAAVIPAKAGIHLPPANWGIDGEPLPTLIAEVCTIDSAKEVADSGANEIILDAFLRHPLPPVSRVQRLRDELAERDVALRLRTPTIVRPEDRRALEKWLQLTLPLETGHLGILAQQSALGRDVMADYATNCFNQHTASEIFSLGASSIILSVELTTDEIAAVVEPWQGRGFGVVVYGRPEGMTIEHCVLSAAFDREPTTCRDLCVQKHTNVELIDPTGYAFPVATDSDCRNRLLHSRPIDGSEFVPRLWNAGVRNYKLIFNVPGERVAEIVSGFRGILDSVAAGETMLSNPVRGSLAGEFTRGHFERAV